jgi:hypothetical protein
VKQISGHDTEEGTEVEPTKCPELMWWNWERAETRRS